GTGSSRDWAAKGTLLLGVKAVIAASFERIHRSNLVGMGVLPLQFLEGTSAQSLGLDGSEKFSITGLSDSIKPGQQVTLEIEKNGEKRSVPVKLRIDTPIEIDYYRHGGILPFVLRPWLSKYVAAEPSFTSWHAVFRKLLAVARKTDWNSGNLSL